MRSDRGIGAERRSRRAAIAAISAIAAIGAALFGCSGETRDSPTLQWRDLEIHVESRSYGPIPEMKELLVFVNRGHTLPAWNCRIDLRTNDADPWTQAIEDGHVGVYRRALKVDDKGHSVLQIWIRTEGNETVLKIPLVRTPAPPAGAGTAS